MPLAPRAGTVAVVGSLNADLTVRTPRLPQAGETVTGGELVVAPGGKSSNQAAVVGRLGGSVRLLGRVGADGHGDLLLDEARAAGVDVDAVGRLEGVATGTAVILVDDEAENVIVVSPGANGRLTAADVQRAGEFFEGAGVVCLCLEVGLDAVAAAAAAAHGAGATVVLNLSPYQPVSASLLELVDVLLVNEHELAQVLGGDGSVDPTATDGSGGSEGSDGLKGSDGWSAAQRSLADLGVHRAVVTLGARGAVVIDGGDASPEPIDPVPVQAVDTTGSGDAFTGALAMRLAAGEGLPDAARFAARVGAFAATRHGAQRSYPTPDELDSLTS